jgi:hypothetical protein
MPGRPGTSRSERTAKKGEKLFRINRKTVGLTYPCPVDREHPIASRETIRDFVTEKFGANFHHVCKESHQSGDRHFHANFKFTEKLDIEDPRAFDINGCHPNICNGGPGWVVYLSKSDPDVLTNVEPCPFRQALAASTVAEGMDILALRRPGDYLRFGQSMERNLRRRLETPRTAILYYGPYVASWFPIDWEPYRHSLLIWGPAGVNKTQFARYLLSHMVGEYDYIKGSHESAKHLSMRRPFIHDEIKCLGDKCPPENSREITDVENGGEVECRNSNVSIPPGLPRIFISNLAFPFRDPQQSVYGRRVVSHEVCVP